MKIPLTYAQLIYALFCPTLSVIFNRYKHTSLRFRDFLVFANYLTDIKLYWKEYYKSVRKGIYTNIIKVCKKLIKKSVRRALNFFPGKKGILSRTTLGTFY